MEEKSMDRIIELANELVQELINNGYNITSIGNDGPIPGLLSVYIWAFKRKYGNTIIIENPCQDIRIEGPYTGTGFEGDPDA
jgi:hypothetical protein